MSSSTQLFMLEDVVSCAVACQARVSDHLLAQAVGQLKLFYFFGPGRLPLPVESLPVPSLPIKVAPTASELGQGGWLQFDDRCWAGERCGCPFSVFSGLDSDEICGS